MNSMEDEDHDELLQCTDDESLSDPEDQCLPIDKPEENYQQTLTFFNHSYVEFILTKVALIVSTTALLILLPLYLQSINTSGNAYSLLLVNSTFSCVFFLIVMGILKLFSAQYKHVKIHSFPLKFTHVFMLSAVYFTSGFLTIYSLDRKRVLCHLQDPIKGIVLIFSLLFYFFFCKKLMGLQRIFSATTIIVGLFIAVDYGLCDEFRCRGYERERYADDGGKWSWKTHAFWTAAYILGLALFAAYFTLLDRYILADDEMEIHMVNAPSSFLSTVSRAVSFPNSNFESNDASSFSRKPELVYLTRKYSIMHLLMWMHVFGFIFIILLFWTEFFPEIGKSANSKEFLNFTTNGILCHFYNPNSMTNYCGNVVYVSWFFLIAYILFIISSMKFLVLSQSAVYTVATMSTSLPLVGIWWSLFHVSNSTTDLLIWSPSVTGELICSLLGLPIILIGLVLLCKSHFKDYQWCRLSTHGIGRAHV